MFTKFTPETRLYIYGVATAAIPLLIAFGAMNEGIAQQVALLLAAILGITSPRMSAVNVNTTPAPVAEPAVEVVAEPELEVPTSLGFLPHQPVVEEDVPAETLVIPKELAV